jgi:type I restriction enzyme R subunit
VLDLLQNYLHVQATTEKVWDAKKGEVVEKTSESLIFPRYHQLDVVRYLLRRAKADGPGHSYLVQHSAGSGKSNSIAWAAHGLRQLYDADGERVFDTIIVVTDRKILDKQLQDTVKQFEQTAGTVVAIDGTSKQLRAALEAGKDIVITTIQKFPVISKSIGGLGGNAFAVVIDEAHSSQSGESAKQLKETLSDAAPSSESASDELDVEDVVEAEVRLRGRQEHVSYFAFTATPKGKTLQIFGRKDPDGRFHAHHLYSMRQAIEEGFILDVLRGYTTYKRYFKLVKAVEDDEEYETSRAVRALTSYVDLTDHAVEEKARIALDLFLNTTARHLKGRGRAMFATRSRLHAVRYFLQFRKLMQARGLAYAPLVAFSGTVHDPKTGADHTESSLNALPYRQKIEDAFKTPDFRLLIVANKYQTGFDEPLLTTMFVDKVLGGVQAVQTLSRLNRQASGKETVVLDFVNEPDAILEAFQPYFQGAVLEEETDPNKLYDLQRQLAEFEVYTPANVEEYARAFFDPSVSGEKIQPPLIRALNQWRARPEEEREDFRSALHSFIRLYAYVTQLVTFVDTDLEKTYVFARSLNKKLDPRERGGLPEGILDSVDLDSFRVQKTFEGEIELTPDPISIPGIPTEAGGGVTEPETDYLSNIITNLNETYGIDLTERDRVRVEEIVEDVRQSDEVRAVMTGNNTRSGQKHVVDKVIDDRVYEEVSQGVDLFKKLSDPRANRVLKARLFDILVREFSQAA